MAPKEFVRIHKLAAPDCFDAYREEGNPPRTRCFVSGASLEDVLSAIRHEFRGHRGFEIHVSLMTHLTVVKIPE